MRTGDAQGQRATCVDQSGEAFAGDAGNLDVVAGERQGTGRRGHGLPVPEVVDEAIGARRDKRNNRKARASDLWEPPVTTPVAMKAGLVDGGDPGRSGWPPGVEDGAQAE